VGAHTAQGPLNRWSHLFFIANTPASQPVGPTDVDNGQVMFELLFVRSGMFHLHAVDVERLIYCL